jgi:hypothetical protein
MDDSVYTYYTIRQDHSTINPRLTGLSLFYQRKEIKKKSNGYKLTLFPINTNILTAAEQNTAAHSSGLLFLQVPLVRDMI